LILLVSGATATKRRYPQCGTLINPSAGNKPESLKLIPERWGMDNYAYSGFNCADFMEMLRAFRGRKGCLFVSAPDVVGDGPATLERWPFWSDVIRAVGFRPALVLQDGMVADEIPWDTVAAVFVGGLTDWKLGPQAASLVGVARARGLWAHMGRVNSFDRISYAAKIGCQSFDGGQYSMFPDRRIPEGLRDAERATTQGPLFV
jgi:hypothetical protein